MPDKTQINLERIRACDAEWEESKHPRSENGQFTSGSGVKVSKATPAMKGGKFNNPKENIKKIGANALKEINKAGSTKQQFEASWKANEAMKKENDKRIAGAAALEKPGRRSQRCVSWQRRHSRLPNRNRRLRNLRKASSS